MDFSTSTLAVKSLQRRKPSLSARTQTIASELLPLITQTNNLQSKQVLTPSQSQLVRSSIIGLLSIGSDSDSDSRGGEHSKDDGKEEETENVMAQGKREQRLRWEPLAVGFHLAAAYLEHLVSIQSRARHEHEPQVYMDGPRVPSLVSHVKHEEEGDVDIDVHVGIGIHVAGSAAASNRPEETKEEMDDLQSFCQTVQAMCLRHLEHDEPRVRTLVAKVVGEYTCLATTAQARHDIIDSAQIFFLHDTITSSLYLHLTQGRDPIIANTTESSNDTNPTVSSHEETTTTTSMNPLKKYSTTSTGALDDTTGWRALETNLYGLCSFIRASSFHYFAWRGGADLEKLLQAVNTCCIDHINRHVRAAGLALLEQLVHASRASFASSSSSSSRSTMTTTTTTLTGTIRSATGQQVEEYGTIMKALVDSNSTMRRIIVKVLKTSLADNWSQVRMAASVLCRVFYTTLLDYRDFNQEIENMVDTELWFTSTFPHLLPRMCLNRFYLAQGVKLYSHETWRILLTRLHPSSPDGSQDPERNIDGEEGMALVGNFAGPVCRYYIQMCDADNHVVREGACQAVAELANKLGTRKEYCDFLAPFVPALLQALLMCFHDESWPVRDEACLACGTFCLAYPEECQPEIDTLFTRWTEQLTDQIWSVREDAAVALGDAIQAYGPSMFERVLVVLKKDLPSARLEPSMSREEYKRRQNDIDQHTNSQLYSCGSLAPKLRKGGAGRIGCSDCLITRPKAPWEATDGCIYLLRELCTRFCYVGAGEGIVFTDETLLPIFTELLDVCRVKHFPQSDDLRATLWKQLPIIAQAMGKQRFKRIYLQLVLELLVENMENRSTCASQLSVHAAGQCAEELAALVGVGIFRGRMEENWQRELFDRVMEERRAIGNVGPSGGGPLEAKFSPFGPMGGKISSRGIGSPLSNFGVDSMSKPKNASTLRGPVPGSGMMDAL